MRRAAVLLAALALAACRVDVEGAPCGEPGSIDDCPSGQACGNDLRCSERATQCRDAALRCTPLVDKRCSADAAVKETCTRIDPCQGWEFVADDGDDCAAADLACGTRSPGGVVACECPPGFTGPGFAADPVEGSPDPGAFPFPTGAARPPECRFKRLGDALSAAGAVAGPAVVRAHGAEGAEIVFGDETSGDAFPLAVPANVTVRAAEAPAGATILRAHAPTEANVVVLQGRIEAFRIESDGATGAGVVTSCGASGRPSLDAVAVEGGQSLASGIDVGPGTCGADLTDLDVSNVAGPALRVRADAGAPVAVPSGRFHASSVGIRVTGGKLTVGVEGEPLSKVEVSGNAGEGIVLTGGMATVLDVQIHNATVSDNGGTGIVLDVVGQSSKLTLRGSTGVSNGVTSPRDYGGATTRQAGGILVSQVSLAAFTFLANRVYANGHDQLAFESSGPWSISPGACGPSSTLFACVDAGAYAVSVAGSGTVDASNTVWPGTPPAAYVNGNVTASDWCSSQTGVPTPPATCP